MKLKEDRDVKDIDNTVTGHLQDPPKYNNYKSNKDTTYLPSSNKVKNVSTHTQSSYLD